jgi:transcriptional regulator with XRE-family HTH domain
MTNPIPDSLGQILAQWRKKRQLSQEQIAHVVRVSRSAIVQLEAGARQLGLYEAKALAEFYGVSIEALFQPPQSMDSHPVLHEPGVAYASPAQSFRPKALPNPTVFVEALLVMLEWTAHQSFHTEQSLIHLIYLSDFEHFSKFETALTGASYTKLGPGLLGCSERSALDHLVGTGRVQRLVETKSNQTTTRLIGWDQANPAVLSGTAYHILLKTAQRFGNLSPEELEQLLINDIPVKSTTIGNVVSYELAFYRQPPFFSLTHESGN